MRGVPLLVDLVLVALATGAVVDVWLNGSIFATARARVETRDNILSELLGCSFCLNYQVPLWLVVLLWLPVVVAPWPVNLICRAWLLWLAAGRLAWLINHAVLGSRHGYDRSHTRIFDEEAHGEEDV
jgi:hypothetical protein